MKSWSRFAKNILLTFSTVLFINCSKAQVRFIKTFHNARNSLESVWRPVEIQNSYYLPIDAIQTQDSVSSQFYILKLDKKGNIIDRKKFESQSNDRGHLININDSLFWKLSCTFDSLMGFRFKFTMLDINLIKKMEIVVPRTFPVNGGPTDEFRFVKLFNGDFIFLLGVSAFDWNPFNKEINGTNFIYLSKNGEIRANKTFAEFSVSGGNYLWQMSNTSVITTCHRNGCKDNCGIAVLFGLDGNLLSSHQLDIGFTKKSGNRFYGFREWELNKYSLVCIDSNFKILSEKKLPETIHPLQFWDLNDNSDFRVRVSTYAAVSVDNPALVFYETMMDTSFTWQKLKLFSGDEQDGMKDLNNHLQSNSEFYSTSDGGALYIFYEAMLANYENNIVVAKVDSNYSWSNNYYSEKDVNLIYPNPCYLDRLFLEIDNWEIIEVFDFSGVKIKSYTNDVQNSFDSIDVSSLKNGIYYLKIILSYKTVINKLLRY